MSDIQLPDPRAWHGAVLLPHLGVIQAEGADTATFLHSQLSQDMVGQPSDQARLAAFCSAKGRMQASLLSVRPQPDLFYLLTDKDVLPGLVKRLSMFVLRAKARLSDASSAMRIVGVLGADAQALWGQAATATSYQVAAHGSGWLVKLPDVLGVQRSYWMGPAADAEALVATLPSLSIESWQWLDVMSGVPRIETSTVDQFVPQMVNFELIGGVNFQKGCYPGQEVVARSQYRGTTKRRAFVLHANAAVSTGQEVFSQADPGQPAGLIINVAPRPGADGAFSALAELKLSAIDTPLFAGSPQGPQLSLGVQPYALPTADEAA